MKYLLFFSLSFLLSILISCNKEKYEDDWQRETIDTLKNEDAYKYWSSVERVKVQKFATLEFIHQSAVRYGDYAFFVSNGLDAVALYNLKDKGIISVTKMNKREVTIFHCNQSTFGISKIDESDRFPLLYVSQRAQADGRCFVEVYRIFFKSSASLTFTLEKVQTIYLPRMTYENALGNANCVIDEKNKLLYVYSRNNNILEDNYGQCRITLFDIPEYKDSVVTLENRDIKSSFSVDCNAFNMQGACINENILFIGQGYQTAGYICLNIIDLVKQKIIKQIDLQLLGIEWEPEGCFYYQGNLMLASTLAIWRVTKE